MRSRRAEAVPAGRARGEDPHIAAQSLGFVSPAISAGLRPLAMRRRDRTEWSAPVRGADASRREAANRDTAETGIARPLPSSRHARAVAHDVRSTSSRVRIHKAAPQPRCPSLSPPIIPIGHAPDPALEQLSIHGDQPDAAMRAKRRLLPSRHGMAVFRTCPSGLIRIYRLAALGTEANRRVTAAMIEIGTGRAQKHSHQVPHECQRAGPKAAPPGRHAIQTAYPPALPERCLKVHSHGGQCVGMLVVGHQEDLWRLRYRSNATTRTSPGRDSMLLTLTIVILLIAGLIISRTQVTRSGKSANLGWMSERWLAEHRASHPR
jgi:hypothetical protein